MKLRLSEDYREWRRFALQFAAIAGFFIWLFSVRRSLAPAIVLSGAAALLVVATLALAQPRWLRPFYRGGMMVSERLGAVTTPLILTILFFGVVTPTAWILRLCGHDPLWLRPRQSLPTYWRPASKPTRLDQMF